MYRTRSSLSICVGPVDSIEVIDRRQIATLLKINNKEYLIASHAISIHPSDEEPTNRHYYFVFKWIADRQNIPEYKFPGGYV